MVHSPLHADLKSPACFLFNQKLNLVLPINWIPPSGFHEALVNFAVASQLKAYTASTPLILRITSKNVLKESHYSSKCQHFGAMQNPVIKHVIKGSCLVPKCHNLLLWCDHLNTFFGYAKDLCAGSIQYALTCVDTGSQLLLATAPIWFQLLQEHVQWE